MTKPPSKKREKDMRICSNCGRKNIALNQGLCIRCGLLKDRNNMIDLFLEEAIKNKGFYYRGKNYTVQETN